MQRLEKDINVAQLDFMESMIGVDGYSILCLLEDKILNNTLKSELLRLALVEDVDSYEISLKRLSFFLEIHEKETIFESLKLVNYLYYNKEMVFSYGEPFPTTKKVSILEHCFGKLGKINIEAFQKAIRECVENVIIRKLQPEQENAKFWANKIRREFIVISGELSDAENETSKIEYWKNICFELNNKSHESNTSFSISSMLIRAALSDGTWLKEHFKPTFLALNMESASAQNIRTKGGNFIEFLLERNDPEILQCVFEKMSEKPYRTNFSTNNSLREMDNCRLNEAVILGQYKTVIRILLEKQININKKNQIYQAPLYLACKYGHWDIAELLLENGADINSSHSIMSGTCLQMLLNKGDFERSRWLINRGASLIRPSITNLDGCSLLHYFCDYGNLDVIHFLLNEENIKTHINRFESQSIRGLTPFQFACVCLPIDIIKRMIECGADMHLPAKNGKTPIQIAEGRSEDIKILLQQSLNIPHNFEYGFLQSSSPNTSDSQEIVPAMVIPEQKNSKIRSFTTIFSQDDLTIQKAKDKKRKNEYVNSTDKKAADDSSITYGRSRKK